MTAKHTLSNLPNDGLLIAVDGPSGTGKSTTCRALARSLNAHYLDTGAMYRVATLQVLRAGISVTDVKSVAQTTTELPLIINDDPNSTSVLLAGEDVAEEIRGTEVTANVSAVSAIAEVRRNLVALQRKLALEAGRCIVEGRDIGTVVLTDAPLKIYLTASAEVRAHRRFNQDISAGRDVQFEEVLADVQRRDTLDSSRSTSPLRPATDAIVVDTSAMTLDDVIAYLTTLVETSAVSSERTPQ